MTDTDDKSAWNERWRSSIQSAQQRENFDAATYRLSAAMYKINPDINHIERLGQAMDMLRACGVDNLNEIIDMVQQGRQADDIISALKKNEAGMGHPSP